jgi:putative Mg2+ transporter-C (MgtC) family protein
MILQVIYSIILGFLIGLERETSGKDIGIRTSSLISLGSTLFCLISSALTQGDPTRIVGQLITGVGFIGAGLIFRSENNIHGLTTAATIWCTAAVGALVGMGLNQLAFVGMLAIIIINKLFIHLKVHDK